MRAAAPDAAERGVRGLFHSCAEAAFRLYQGTNTNREGFMAKGTSGGARGGLARPVTPSADLAAITGSAPLPRSQVVSKIWDHIRKNNLQNPQNKREIVADDKLRKVFGKDRATMFEMNKLLSNHLK
jgi:chromatin remodeling complex protein RSC6